MQFTRLIMSMLILMSHPDLNLENPIESKKTGNNENQDDYCEIFPYQNFKQGRFNHTHYQAFYEDKFFWLDMRQDYPLKRFSKSVGPWLEPGFIPVGGIEMCHKLHMFEYKEKYVTRLYNNETGQAQFKILSERSGEMIEEKYEESLELSLVIIKGICNSTNYERIAKNQSQAHEPELKLRAVTKKDYIKLLPRTLNGDQVFLIENPNVADGYRKEYFPINLNTNDFCLDQKCEKRKELANCGRSKYKIESTPHTLTNVIIVENKPNQNKTEKGPIDHQFYIGIVITIAVIVIAVVSMVNLYRNERWRQLRREEIRHNIQMYHLNQEQTQPLEQNTN